MLARCAALRAACSFRKKINSSSSKFEAQITSVPLITNSRHLTADIEFSIQDHLATDLESDSSYISSHSQNPTLKYLDFRAVLPLRNRRKSSCKCAVSKIRLTR
ncbi:hypothetical protein J6590_056272 [Homalodisca vitripennis]|nr:hypothetical protein J6590_056272 [Homalodisca vitripennis]